MKSILLAEKPCNFTKFSLPLLSVVRVAAVGEVGVTAIQSGK